MTRSHSARSRLAKVTKSVLGSAVMAAGLGAGAIAAAPQAHAAGGTYYIEIGGTCDGAGQVFNGLNLNGGTALRVNYPATLPGFSCGQIPFDQSVATGRQNAERVLNDAHNADPSGRFVIVGYSQGAEVAELVLNDVADGRTGVPRGQVTGKIYASPMTPGTGIYRLFPIGFTVPVMGLRSIGTGRIDFNGVRYQRYCITDDGICDTRNLFTAIGGYFAQHPCYRGAVMPSTIADNSYLNNTRWYPKVDCHVPWPTR